MSDGNFVQAPGPCQESTVSMNANYDHEATTSRSQETPDQKTVCVSNPLLTPRELNDYVLLEVVGRGGMGVVWKARQKSLSRIVAVKLIHASLFSSPQDKARFAREARSTAYLDHPAIVPLYDAGECNGEHYLAMAFIEAPTLADKLANGPVPPRTAAELVKVLAEAVAYAHSRNIIHRDLKPGNILLCQDGKPMIVDFGLAKFLGAETGLTATGQILGTPSYMSPEQASGRIAEVSKESDIYSLGAILYSCLTSRPPFQSKTVADTLMQVCTAEPTSPRTLNKTIDRNLETLCLKCLEKSIANRYKTADDLVDDLARYLAGQPISARRTSSLIKLVRSCRHHLAAIILTSAIGLTAFFLLLLFLQEGSRRNQPDATGETTPSSRTVAPTVAKPSPPQNPARDPDLLVVAGRLAEAGNELDRLRELNSSQIWKPWYVSAPLFIENGDVDGYKMLCSEMLIRFADSTKPGDISKLAKACLLLPPAESDLTKIYQLTNRAIDLGAESSELPWYHVTHGLALYRMGDYEKAITPLKKGDTPEEPRRRAQAFLILSMVYHNLGRSQESKVVFQKAAEIMESELAQPSHPDFRYQWHDWFIARILRREAENTIDEHAENERTQN